MKKPGFFFAAILLILMTACSAAKTSEPAVFRLANSPATAVYEKDSIKITVKPAEEADVAGNALFEELLHKGYVLLKMDMENKSTKKLAFNPAMSHLLAGAMDYKKPLGYPDLYEMFSGSGANEAKLRAIHGRFYDTGVTVKAGEKTSKILIFRPLEPGSKSASFAMQELYADTDTVAVTFPFSVERK